MAQADQHHATDHRGPRKIRPRRAGPELVNLVVDTSVVAKLFLRDEKYIERTDALFSAHVNGEIRLVAPVAVYYELPASLLKAVRETRLDGRSAARALTLFFDLDMPVVGGTKDSAARMSQAAYRLAANLGCSYYDGVFLGLVELLGTVVVSADDKLWRNIGSRTPLLVWIEDYAIR